MLEIWKDYFKILILKPEPFERTKQDDKGMWPGLQFFLVVGLIAGLGKWIGIQALLERPTLAELVAQVASKVGSFAADFLPPILSDPVSEVAQGAIEIASQLTQLEPSLGARPSRLLRLVGDWLSTPFELLTAWMAFIILVWLLAKMVGGKGSLSQHFNLLYLAAAPLVLTMVWFAGVEQGSQLYTIAVFLMLVAFVWSIVVSVRALAVAHELATRLVAWSMVIFLVVILVAIPLLAVLVAQISLTLS